MKSVVKASDGVQKVVGSFPSGSGSIDFLHVSHKIIKLKLFDCDLLLAYW